MIKVYLVAETKINLKQIERFLHENDLAWNRTDANRSEGLIEFAGRICKMSFGKKQITTTTTEFIRGLIIKGHDSVLEHLSWSFLITGVSRALTHQLVRHRVGFSFSQLSQQYSDQSEIQFLEPDSIKRDSELHEKWQRLTSETRTLYCEIIDKLNPLRLRGIDEESSRQINSSARSILPNSTETKVLATANARALRHFFRIRGSIKGDQEMRALSVAIFEIVKKRAPSVFSDFYIKKISDGTRILKFHENNIRGGELPKTKEY